MSFKIGVIGTGYVGLVTGVCFAATGNRVHCIDIDKDKINKLKEGICPIFEPGLEKLLEQVIKEEAIEFSMDLEKLVKESLMIFLCLPTPPNGDGSADLSRVKDVTRQIAEIIKKNGIKEKRILINKSTVPVGTSEISRRILNEVDPDVDIYVASNPEFLREGFAVDDAMKPERIVVGVDDPYVEEVMKELYQPFIRTGNPIYFMDLKSAELTKYAANCFLATKISFMNNLSEYCEKIGVNIDKVRIGIGSDSRIGKRFLFPGVGYGGSCFPKDVKALLYSAEQAGTPLRIVQAAEDVNLYQIERFFNRILKRFDGNLKGKSLAIWGLAFKPNTDDVRDAPSFKLIDRLLEHGARIKVYDPEAIENTERIYGNKLEYTKNKYDCTEEAEALIIVTEWNNFRNPDFDELSRLLKNPIIFDGRNLFETNEMDEKGFEYYSIGR
jgi:UDPglucose 6-dehydrogenase